jgi:CheY-like chemotaxis protein
MRQSEPGQPATARTTVLVVDEDVALNRLVARSLGAQYQVISAFDGQEGLAQALAVRPSMIVSDIMMPVMTGIEMIAEIRKRPSSRTRPSWSCRPRRTRN